MIAADGVSPGGPQETNFKDSTLYGNAVKYSPEGISLSFVAVVVVVRPPNRSRTNARIFTYPATKILHNVVCSGLTSDRSK